MNRNRIAAGVLAAAMVFSGASPIIGAIDTSLTAYAATKPSWDVKKYYEAGQFTFQYFDER